MTWAEKIISYNRQLHFPGKLPKGIRIMNPYAESTAAWESSELFYKKYYADTLPRKLILGINPGRFGAGATGIPFTDPKRLAEAVHLPWNGPITHEPSSVYVYDVIRAYGGPEAFYRDYFINSVSPLGYTILRDGGKEVNYNYYDSPQLFKSVIPFITTNLDTLRSMGFDMSTCYCLGVKNAKCLTEINEKGKWFSRIEVLEHPRYIMQYRSKMKDDYIRKYIEILSEMGK